MKFQGESSFQAPRDQVWAAIVDPRRLLSGLSGFQRLDPIGEHEYEGAFEVSIGEVKGDFQGTLELADLKPPSSLRFSLNAMGAAGFVDGDGLMVLEEAGGGTRIHYDLDAKIGGRIASVGEQAIKESAAALARRTLDSLAGRPGATPPRPKFKVLTRQEASTPVEPSSGAGVRPPDPVVGATTAASAPALEEPTSHTPEPETTESSIPGPASVPATALAESPAASDAVAEPPLPRQGQYGSRVSQDLPERLRAIGRRPTVLAIALVLYTVFVILMTRACS